MTARLCSTSFRPVLKCGPTIAADAGEPRNSLANRSFSMNVMSPGPASPTGRAERIDTLPSPTKRPRTNSASCSTVATTGVFLSSLKGEDEDQGVAVERSPNLPIVPARGDSTWIRVAIGQMTLPDQSDANPSRLGGQGESSDSP